MIKTCLYIGNEDISHNDVMGKFDVNFTIRHNYKQDWHWRFKSCGMRCHTGWYTVTCVLENYAVSLSRLV